MWPRGIVGIFAPKNFSPLDLISSYFCLFIGRCFVETIHLISNECEHVRVYFSVVLVFAVTTQTRKQIRCTLFIAWYVLNLLIWSDIYLPFNYFTFIDDMVSAALDFRCKHAFGITHLLNLFHFGHSMYSSIHHPAIKKRKNYEIEWESQELTCSMPS